MAGRSAVAERAPDAPDAPDASGEQAPGSSPNGTSAKPDSEATVAELRAENERLRADLKTANEKRIPDLQRLLDSEKEAAKKATEQAKAFRSGMLEWVRGVLVKNDLEVEWKEIERREQERTGQVLQTQASRAETVETINDLLASDDPDEQKFGRFLRSQVRAANAGGTVLRVNTENIEHFRTMFNESRGITAPPQGGDEKPAASAGTPSATTTPSGQQPPAAAPRTPPSVPGAGTPPATRPSTEEPAYKPGDNPQALFGRWLQGIRRSAGETEE